jgi:hypothetical protein
MYHTLYVKKFANLIDWLYATCLEYFIFSIDSSEARKQYLMHMPERMFKAPDGSFPLI